VPAYDPVTNAKTDMKIDHFLDIRWHAPAIMRLHISLMPEGSFAGREKTLREDLPGQFAAHILTPETATTTHYFWSSNHPTDLNSEMTKEAGRALLLVAFEEEDKVLLEAVQENMEGEFWSCKPILLRNDAGGVLARRRLAKMIADESRSAVPESATKAEKAALNVQTS
jgi:vanillate O-demethylase monooxygenase subunit